MPDGTLNEGSSGSIATRAAPKRARRRHTNASKSVLIGPEAYLITSVKMTMPRNTLCVE
jgi:hypothetical protein